MAQQGSHLFLTSPALLTQALYHHSLLVDRPIETGPVFPAAVTDDDARKAAAESDAEASVLEHGPVKTCE